MPLVVADTSPIFYLLSIGQIELLHLLFKTVFVPDAVYRELCHPTAPAVLREWVTKLPAWLDVVRIAEVEDISLKTLGAGERAAITLASSIGADLILIDERKGTAAALASGFDVTGTLGILRLAAQESLIDIADTLDRLKGTNFRYRQEMIDDLLNEFPRRV